MAEGRGQYRIPSMPLTAAFYTNGSAYGASPRVVYNCQMQMGERCALGLPGIPAEPILPVGTMFLLLPFASDIRGTCSPGGADLVNVYDSNLTDPPFSQWYTVSWADSVAVPRSNQHDVAVVVQCCPFYKQGGPTAPPYWPFASSSSSSSASSAKSSSSSSNTSSSSSSSHASSSSSSSGGGGSCNPNFTNYAENSATSATSIPFTFAPTTAGSCLVCGIALIGSTTVGVPSGWNPTWVQVSGGAGSFTLYMFSANNASSVSSATFTFSGTISYAVGVFGELKGALNPSSDQVAHANGTGTSLSIGPTGLLIQGCETGIVCAATTADTEPSWNTPFSQAGGFNAGAGLGISMGYDYVTVNAALTATGSTSPFTGDWAGILQTFRC